MTEAELDQATTVLQMAIVLVLWLIVFAETVGVLTDRPRSRLACALTLTATAVLAATLIWLALSVHSTAALLRTDAMTRPERPTPPPLSRQQLLELPTPDLLARYDALVQADALTTALAERVRALDRALVAFRVLDGRGR